MATFIQSGPVLFLVSLRQTSPQYMKNKVTSIVENLSVQTHKPSSSSRTFCTQTRTGYTGSPCLTDTCCCGPQTQDAWSATRVPSVPAFPPSLFTFLCGPLEGNKVGSMATERAKIPGRTSCPRQRLMLLSGSLDKLGNTEIVVNESVTTLLPFSPNGLFYFFKIVKILHKYPVNDKVKIVCLKFLQTY